MYVYVHILSPLIHLLDPLSTPPFNSKNDLNHQTGSQHPQQTETFPISTQTHIDWLHFDLKKKPPFPFSCSCTLKAFLLVWFQVNCYAPSGSFLFLPDLLLALLLLSCGSVTGCDFCSCKPISFVASIGSD